MSYAMMMMKDSSADETPRNSVGYVSEASTTQAKMVVDKMYLELNDIDKNNARIKKQIMRFNQLD